MNAHPAPGRGRLVINVELDDRSFLFPDGKVLTHISVFEDEAERVRLEGVFPFNAARTDTLIQALDIDDARDFARAILDAVVQGRTQHVLSEEAKVAVTFNPNGFVIRFGEERALREVYINSPAIIRLAQGILRLVDHVEAAPDQ